MNLATELIIKFYEDIWNKYDKNAIPELIHDSFIFHGSLGIEKHGRAGFIEYLDMVHGALGSYECSVMNVVAEESKVFAKMRFTGVHQSVFLGIEPTGKRVVWDGAALFHFIDNKISELWVIGDIKSLEAQLNDNRK